MKENNQLPEIVPVSKFNDYIPYPSCASIRQLIYFNVDNFNEKVLRRVGKRLYINIPAFFEWVEETNSKQQPA